MPVNGAGLELKLAVNWLEKLVKLFIKLQVEKEEQLNSIGNQLLVVPKDLVPVYVEPEAQMHNPADDRSTLGAFPVFKYIQEFISTRKDRHEQRVLFILADAGMGKTSLLAMLLLTKVVGFWPKSYDCVAFKLGPDTLDDIKKIKSRANTVLLLDALDEDPEAFGRVFPRIKEIYEATQGFYRVLITCRNQFLPLGNTEAFPRQDRIYVNGNTSEVIYCSPFSDEKIATYLKKIYPDSMLAKIGLKNNEKFQDANKLIDGIKGDLMCRPLLLTYIDNLMEENTGDNIYRIYKTIVNKWIDREVAKESTSISVEELRNMCVAMAEYMEENDTRVVKEETLVELLADNFDPKRIEGLSIGSRSLLNKNSEGDLLFSHYSFQEFFLVYRTLTLGRLPKWKKSTEMILAFLGSADLTGVNSEGGFPNHALSGLYAIDPRCSDSGFDQYGLWMSIDIAGEAHKFRWIPAGEFSMGSPKNEEGRYDHETQHHVTLTEGFWLGETTVTQVQWQSVMKKNPSHFKGADKPVDSVSWNDAQEYLENVGQYASVLKAHLPTEAQWEYACRAGTTTAFSFGNELTREHANYSGNWDDCSAQGDTKAAKEFSPNAWGLYQMHGNVWEWCLDALKVLEQEAATDPCHYSSDADVDRALRGGSWHGSGRGLRSAYRLARRPSSRNRSIGLRLALGQVSSG